MSSSVGMMKFPIYGKIKNVPNHQPEGFWTLLKWFLIQWLCHVPVPRIHLWLLIEKLIPNIWRPVATFPGSTRAWQQLESLHSHICMISHKITINHHYVIINHHKSS
jgi:hypothetical protein